MRNNENSLYNFLLFYLWAECAYIYILWFCYLYVYVEEGLFSTFNIYENQTNKYKPVVKKIEEFYERLSRFS